MRRNISDNPGIYEDSTGKVELDLDTGLPEIPQNWFWKVEKGYSAYYLKLYFQPADIEVKTLFGGTKMKTQKAKMFGEEYMSGTVPTPEKVLEEAVDLIRRFRRDYGQKWWDVLPYATEEAILGEYRPGGERRLGGPK